VELEKASMAKLPIVNPEVKYNLRSCIEFSKLDKKHIGVITCVGRDLLVFNSPLQP